MTIAQNITLFCGLTVTVASLVLYTRKMEKPAALLLTIGGCFIFCFAALLDPFLNLWDERFHALVAKNMMEHPFTPMLYADPVLDMAYDRWDRATVWLHKQPLFLWQIALSFKIFRVSEFTLRLPGAVLLSVCIYSIYRMGKILVNGSVGFLSALLFIGNFYVLQVISGRQQLDVNDAAFTAYVCLSIWALLEYYDSKNKFWIVLIGVFAGAAVLCKWLAGLLVYLVWAFFISLNKKDRKNQTKNLFVALGATSAIVAPWQIYTLLSFPKEATQEMAYNSEHFFTALEGHEENIWFHFQILPEMYGSIIWWLILPAILLFAFKDKHHYLRISLVGAVIFVYLFFTIAATKMPSFTLLVMPVLLIAVAYFIQLILQQTVGGPERSLTHRILFLIVGIGCTVFNFNFEQLQTQHFSENNEYIDKLSRNKETFKNLPISENTILLNVKGRHYVEAMFYTEVPAYNFVPNEKEVQRLLGLGKQLLIFRPTEALPDYITNCTSCKIYDKKIEGWE